MTDPRVIHFEIVGKDGKALQAYYGALFGWKLNTDTPGGYGMTEPGGDRPRGRDRLDAGRLGRSRHRLRHGGRHRRDPGQGRCPGRQGDHAQVPARAVGPPWPWSPIPKGTSWA